MAITSTLWKRLRGMPGQGSATRVRVARGRCRKRVEEPRAAMHDRTVRDMPIEELRSRVEEAEKILRVARRLAQDDLRKPESSERAKDRIASLCSDVSALFPGLGQPGAATAAVEAAVADEVEAADEEEVEGEEGDEATGGDEGDEAEEEGEWDVDYEKLRASLCNPELMGRFPEAERAQFAAMAQQLLDAHDRHELYARVSEGFAQLEETTRSGAEQVRRQLELALTLEELRAKKLD
jgi:hypothetical protein